MARYLLLALLFVFATGGCSSDRVFAPQLSEEDQIREAVFRYQFEFNASGQGQSANVYFLRLEGDRDPGPPLLQRFRGHRPPVKPASASTLEAGTALVVDSESHLPGLIFWITEIRWLGDDEVEVDGGYEEASESAAGSVYYLKGARGRWEVVEAQMLWIK